MRKIVSMNHYMLGAHALMAMSMADSFICHADDESLSLADLAGLDVSEIEEIRFESLPGGVYDLKVIEAELKEGTNKDGDKRFEAAWTFEVLECKMVVTAGVDKESLAGKKHTERFFLDPSKTQDEIGKAIGRIRAFVTDMGCESAGTLGDIVRNTKDHVFTGKIVEQPDKDDKSIKYARLRLEKKK